MMNFDNTTPNPDAGPEGQEGKSPSRQKSHKNLSGRLAPHAKDSPSASPLDAKKKSTKFSQIFKEKQVQQEEEARRMAVFTRKAPNPTSFSDRAFSKQPSVPFVHDRGSAANNAASPGHSHPGDSGLKAAGMRPGSWNHLTSPQPGGALVPKSPVTPGSLGDAQLFGTDELASGFLTEQLVPNLPEASEDRETPKQAARKAQIAADDAETRRPGFKEDPAGWINYKTGYDAKKLLIIAGVILALILAVVIATTQLGDNGSKEIDPDSPEDIAKQLEAGTSQTLANQLIPLLKQNNQLAWIAKHTSEYSDPQIVELACREPAAIEFVYKWPSAKKTAQPYQDKVQKGAAPLLYCWDKRWGNVDYGGLPLAVTGACPTTFSMAYMAATGKTDMTPDMVAADAASAGMISEKGITSPQFVLEEGKRLKLNVREISASQDAVSEALGKRHLIVAHVKDSPNVSYDHWLLIADHLANGSVVIYDPTSTQNSAHAWDLATILDEADSLYEVGPGQSTSSARTSGK